uniref:nesprin-1-like n=1 Tax=Solea senegalensis TaxID=28829 RepID=UPI001CD8439F|nr:nesprin-1-like [Solea senegalensis]
MNEETVCLFVYCPSVSAGSAPSWSLRPVVSAESSLLSLEPRSTPGSGRSRQGERERERERENEREREGEGRRGHSGGFSSSSSPSHPPSPSHTVTLEQQGASDRCVVFVSQAAQEPGPEPGPGLDPGPEPGPGLGPGPGVGLHVCLQKADQLEAWLQEAQRILGKAAGSCGVVMQESVEQQLVTCQEMFLEIQQKMDSLSALGPVSDLELDLGPEPGPDLGLGQVVSQQEAAELLFSKVKLLKQKLVSFQKLLQEEKKVDNTETQQQQQQQQRPPQSELRRSSVQEIFSSPRNKFLRQNSLQQQKELEQDLSEQRGLTQAIARLCSQESEELSQPSPWGPPAGPDVRAVDQEKKWAALHSGFLAVEQLWLLPPSEVTDSWRRRRRSDGTAGRVIVPQSLIRRLGELGLRASAQSLDEVSRQTLDEDLFLVLHDVSLSLSSIKHLLDSPESSRCEEDEDEVEETLPKLLQLQSLSAELLTLGDELSSQGSKVTAVLGSECVQRCVDDLSRVLPVVQAALTSREKQLKNLQEETVKQKRRLSELHAAFTSNKTTPPPPPQITNKLSETLSPNQQLQVVNETQASLQLQVTQVKSLLEDVEQRNPSSSLVHQVQQLQGELDSSLRGVHCHCEQLTSSEELQHMFEQLLHSLQELLTLGHERLTHQEQQQQQEEEAELQSRSHLQQQLSSHTFITS